MMYGSWDIWHNEENILSFWAIFCPFTLKNWKKRQEILSFYTGLFIINDDHMMYGSLYMEHNRQDVLSFWANFCPLGPFTTRKIKILQKWKKLHEILSFYACAPKIMVTGCTVPEAWYENKWRADRPKDGRTKTVTYRGGCPT